MDDFWEDIGEFLLEIVKIIFSLFWEWILEKILELIFYVLIHIIGGVIMLAWSGILLAWTKITSLFSRKKQEKEERACNMPKYPADELCEIKTATEG